MFRRIYLWARKHLLGIDDRSQLEIAIENGLIMGEDCHIMGGCIMDPGHCWLIEIGDRVVMGPHCHILAHDASTKRDLGYTRIANVVIGNDVFIGAGSIILPGVSIGDRVVIGAGSVVTHSISANSVAVGNPCKVIGTYDDFIRRQSDLLREAPVYGEDYRIGMITTEKRQKMKDDLSSFGQGYVV